MSGSPPRPLDASLRRSRATQAGVVAAVLIGAAFANPDRPSPIDLCGFKSLTGLPCPTCGLTRALCHAMRGDWAQSLNYHPAGMLLAVALIGWALWLTAEAARGRPLAEVPRIRLGASLLHAGAALSIVSWVVRLAGLGSLHG